jgi:hypothetical protein
MMTPSTKQEDQMKIKATEIDSSSIAEMVWEDDEIEVRFQNGGHYRYEGVTLDTMDKILTAPSIGSAFHSIIKLGGFAYERIG